MQPQQNQPQNEGFFADAAATIKAAQQAVNTRVDAVVEPFLRDGTLAAAFRQGASELYTALKPFPDTIQVNQPGTILNPTQGEIAADRKPDAPSPSDIAREDSPSPPDAGQEHAHEMGRGR
jgi:hypothetical protein